MSRDLIEDHRCADAVVHRNDATSDDRHVPAEARWCCPLLGPRS